MSGFVFPYMCQICNWGFKMATFPCKFIIPSKLNMIENERKWSLTFMNYCLPSWENMRFMFSIFHFWYNSTQVKGLYMTYLFCQMLRLLQCCCFLCPLLGRYWHRIPAPLLYLGLFCKLKSFSEIKRMPFLFFFLIIFLLSTFGPGVLGSLELFNLISHSCFCCQMNHVIINWILFIQQLCIVVFTWCRTCSCSSSPRDICF